MPRSYFCRDNICDTRGRSHLENHGEAIEHLRGYHRQFFIKRPNELGVPDSRAIIGTASMPNAVTINRAKTIEVSDPTEPCGTTSVIATTEAWIVFARLIRLLQCEHLTTAVREQRILPDDRA